MRMSPFDRWQKTGQVSLGLRYNERCPTGRINDHQQAELTFLLL
jgi:hypothetical protein